MAVGILVRYTWMKWILVPEEEGSINRYWRCFKRKALWFAPPGQRLKHLSFLPHVPQTDLLVENKGAEGLTTCSKKRKVTFFSHNQPPSTSLFSAYLLRNPKDFNSFCMQQGPHFLLSGHNGWDACWQNIHSFPREMSCQIIIRQQETAGNRA